MERKIQKATCLVLAATMIALLVCSCAPATITTPVRELVAADEEPTPTIRELWRKACDYFEHTYQEVDCEQEPWASCFGSFHMWNCLRDMITEESPSVATITPVVDKPLALAEKDFLEVELPANIPTKLSGEILQDIFFAGLGVMMPLRGRIKEMNFPRLPSSVLEAGVLPRYEEATVWAWPEPGGTTFCLSLKGQPFEIVETRDSLTQIRLDFDHNRTWKKDGLWWIEFAGDDPLPKEEIIPYEKITDFSPTGRLMIAKQADRQAEKLWIQGAIRIHYFAGAQTEIVYVSVETLSQKGVALLIPKVTEIQIIHPLFEGWTRQDTYKALAIGAAIIVGGSLVVAAGKAYGLLPAGLATNVLGGVGSAIWTAARWVVIKVGPMVGRIGLVVAQTALDIACLAFIGIGYVLWKAAVVTWTIGSEVVVGVGTLAGWTLKFFAEAVIKAGSKIIVWIIKMVFSFIGFLPDADLPRHRPIPDQPHPAPATAVA